MASTAHAVGGTLVVSSGVGAVRQQTSIAARNFPSAHDLVVRAEEILRECAPQMVSEKQLRTWLIEGELTKQNAVFNASVGIGTVEAELNNSLAVAMDNLEHMDDIEAVGKTTRQFLYNGPAAGVRNRADLLAVLKDRPRGTHFEDLRKAYTGVERDIDRLWKRGRVVAVQNPRRTDSRGGTDASARIANSLLGLVIYPREERFGHQYCLTRLPGLHRLQKSEPRHVTTTCDLRPFVRRGDAIVIVPQSVLDALGWKALPGFGELDDRETRVLVEREKSDELVFRVDNFDGVRFVDEAAGEKANGEADQVAKLARYSVASGCDLDTEGRERPRTIKGERGRGDSDNSFTARLLPLDRLWWCPAPSGGASGAAASGAATAESLVNIDPEENVVVLRFGVANDLRSLWAETIEQPAPWPEDAELRAELTAAGQQTMGVEGSARRKRPGRGRKGRKRKRNGGKLKMLTQTHLIGTALGAAIMRGQR